VWQSAVQRLDSSEPGPCPMNLGEKGMILFGGGNMPAVCEPTA
jgi:hypothetical protein